MSSSAPMKPVTLVVQNGDGGETALLNGYAALNKEFEAAHPGVTIKFVTKNFNDLVNTLKLQLSGSAPPDVTQVNQGYGSMGQLVTDGLLTNLDNYAAKYGWSTRQPAALLAMDGKFTTDGKTMGSGPLWGMSATGAWVGLFENTEVARRLGIAGPPATLADLEADFAAAKTKGITPLQFGSSDGGESAWLLATLIASQGSPQDLLDIVMAKSETTLNSPLTLKVANTIKDWSDKGYFTKGWSAYNNGDVFTKFTTGDGLFVLNGSWYVPLPASANSANFAMIPFPSATSGSAPVGVAAGDLPWTIPAKSKNHDLAAEYIDFITSSKAAVTWITSGNVPATLPSDVAGAIAAAKLTGPSKDAVAGWQKIMTEGTPVPYIDWATPTLYNTIESSLAELAGDRATPQGFADALQKDYGAFVQSK